jgi:hypothetical protein
MYFRESEVLASFYGQNLLSMWFVCDELNFYNILIEPQKKRRILRYAYQYLKDIASFINATDSEVSYFY